MPEWPGEIVSVYVLMCPNDNCMCDVQVRVADDDDGTQVTCPYCDCIFTFHFPRVAER